MSAAGVSADELSSFSRAALSVLSRREEGLVPAGTPRVLAHSDGGANRLVEMTAARGRVILKVRVAAGDDGASEAWALKRAPPRLCPRLLAQSSSMELRARAAREGRFDLLRELDPQGGGVLVLEHVEGRVPDAGVSADVVATAQAIARLHGKRLQTGPRLRTGSSPGALVSLSRRLLADVERATLVDDATSRALGAALRRAVRLAERARRAPRVRGLCHGDLRWHNALIVEDGSARLLDLEHAGVGDPAVDLALMACRTPLNEHEELTLLDAYLAARRDATLLDRYFALKPLVGLVGALAGVVDLSLVSTGRRPCAEDSAIYVGRRANAAALEVEDALSRLDRPAGTQPRLKLPVPRAKRRVKRLGRCAVDGTASSGKSVLARAVAERFGVPYFNTGAAYRFAALLALEAGWRAGDEHDVGMLARAVSRAGARLDDEGGLRVGARRLDAALYVHEVDLVVARLAADPRIRGALAETISPALRPPDAVIEGRDIGSVLLPGARRRLFIDATPRVRAERTLERLGRRLSLGTIEKALLARDRLDRERATAPLVVARGALVVDTTRLSEPAAVARVLELIAP